MTRGEATSMRFDANVSILFPELPLRERPAAAAAEGFDSIEMWWPFDRDIPTGREIDDLAEWVGLAGVDVVSLNLSGGSRAAGEHGLVALPGQETRFRDHVDAAVAVAGRLGVRVLNALYGNTPPDIDPGLVSETAIGNLTYAARQATAAGATIVVEALNPVDFPRYGIHRIESAIDVADLVLAATGARIGILFDVYHVQRSEGDLIARIEAYASRFGHVQIADSPGRQHPGTGEIAFERVLPALDRAGYGGHVGLEYSPSASRIETFAWLPLEARRARTPGPGTTTPTSEAEADSFGASWKSEASQV